jgi:hypothetical protein
MKEITSLSQQLSASAPERASPRPESAGKVDHRPLVSKLFGRMFGTAAVQAHSATFAHTEWQETVWQDTRSLPPRT